MQAPEPSDPPTPTDTQTRLGVEPIPIGRASFIAARAAVAAGLVFSLLMFLLMVRSGMSGIQSLVAERTFWVYGQLAIALVSLVARLLCVTLYLRSPFLPAHQYVLRRLFLTVFVLTLFSVIWHITSELVTAPPSSLTLDENVYWIARQLPDAIGLALHLLIPLFLVSVATRDLWRKRACQLAAASALCIGIAATWNWVLTLSSTSGQLELQHTWLERFQKSIREPLPFIGLWPIGGLVACVLFLVAAAKPKSSRLPIIGIILVVISSAASNHWIASSLLQSFRMDVWDGIFWLQQIILHILILPLPVWLLAYGLWFERRDSLPA